MSKLPVFATMLLVLALLTQVSASPVEFQLLTHVDNMQWLPQETYMSGDYLIQTGSDDDQKSSYNPEGCFSFNFMNPDAEPDGYAAGIH
ncbi:MAG: hypothetical protein KAV87_39490 [Desulfobacteraceae bacterium]|nr:hypothetical protein [Desulfobacteraceae bacterium]